jgi:hypothetical protein
MNFNNLNKLKSHLIKNSLELYNIDFELKDALDHFSPLHLPENEFEYLATLIADDLVLQWKIGESEENHPIGVVTSDGEIHIIAKTEIEFIQLLPYGIRSIAGIAEYLSYKGVDEDTLKTALSYYPPEEFENMKLYIETEYNSAALYQFMQDNEIPFHSDPIQIIANAIQLSPSYQKRLRGLGLPF